MSGVHGKGDISLEEIIGKMKANPDFPEAGAIAIFVGVVRGVANTEDTVEKLELKLTKKKQMRFCSIYART